ncbi:hypothetical protein BJX61DRAFT_540152 [Aspergillus egyptiacus]|nr:hypothetical protein BJX61DRAFT_540152 [Aspergillus egyptiacus]
MRLPLLLLMTTPHTILANTPPDPLAIISNAEIQSSVKQILSAASSLSSLIGKEVPPTLLDRLHSDSPEAKEPVDIDLDLSASIEVLSQLKNAASVASSLREIAENKPGIARPSEESTPKNYPRSADEQEPLDEALQGLSSIAANLKDLSSLLKSKKVNIDIDTKAKPKPSPPETPEPEGPKPTAPEPDLANEPESAPQQNEHESPDMLTHLETLKTFTTLFSKFSLLNTTTTTPTTDPAAALTSLLSETGPDLLSAWHYLTTHASTLLTPPLLDTLLSLLDNNALLPSGTGSKYKETTLEVLAALRPLFSPQFARDFHRAKAAVESAGVDFASVLGGAGNFFRFVVEDFGKDDAGGVQWIFGKYNEARLWMEALKSEEMREFVAFLEDPGTLERIRSVGEEVKGKMTVERVHALRGLLEQEGVLGLEEGVYRRVGEGVGKWIQGLFMTSEGVEEVQQFVDILETVVSGGGVEGVCGVLQMRAGILRPEMVDPLYGVCRASREGAEVLSKVIGVLQEVLRIVRSLLDPGSRKDRVFDWGFWDDVVKVLDDVAAILERAGAVQSFLEALERVVEPECVDGLKDLISDATRILSAPTLLAPGPVSIAGNVSAMVVQDGFESLVMLDTAPALAPEVLETVLGLLDRVGALLEPGEVAKTREALLEANKAASFVVKVVEVFNEEGPQLEPGDC